MVAAFEHLRDLPGTGLILLAMLSAARPLGLLFGFILFSWAMAESRLLRLNISFAIGLPMLMPSLPALTEQIRDAQIQQFAFILPKEFFIGYMLGFLASLPLLSLQYAGGIHDSVRGENNSDIPDPVGGTISTWGKLYLLVGGAIFIGAGGLEELVHTLFKSYARWPVMSLLPIIPEQGPRAIVASVTESMVTAVVLAAPLLLVFLAIYTTLGFGSRFARKIELLSNEFLLKNLVAILLLPLLMATFLVYIDHAPFDQSTTFDLLRRVFQ